MFHDKTGCVERSGKKRPRQTGGIRVQTMFSALAYTGFNAISLSLVELDEMSSGG